jgi:hypothetical protein
MSYPIDLVLCFLEVRDISTVFVMIGAEPNTGTMQPLTTMPQTRNPDELLHFYDSAC